MSISNFNLTSKATEFLEWGKRGLEAVEENRISWKNDTSGAREKLSMTIAGIFALVTAFSLRSIYTEKKGNKEAPPIAQPPVQKPYEPSLLNRAALRVISFAVNTALAIEESKPKIVNAIIHDPQKVILLAIFIYGLLQSSDS